MRNFGFGTESARCVSVEFSVHFGTSKLTFGASLALLEAKKYAIDYRLVYIRFLHAVKSAIFVFPVCEWTGWGDFRVSFGLIF